MATTIILTPDLARKVIAEQCPEYSHLPITDVEKQGHDGPKRRFLMNQNLSIASEWFVGGIVW